MINATREGSWKRPLLNKKCSSMARLNKPLTYLLISSLLVFPLQDQYCISQNSHSNYSVMSAEDNTYVEDDWPKMPDSTDFDGKQLLSLVRGGNSPFHGAWDVNLLIREIEKNLGAQVIDIPVV